MPITVAGTQITFNDLTVQTTAYTGSAAAPDVQTFNSSGTWTKPSGRTMACIQVWGGGGGGSRYSTSNKGGGAGGGGYNEVTVPISYLASSVSITVGAGGTGATTAASGASGGTSSVPLTTAWTGVSTISAYGGGGGYILSGNGYGGGGGGPSGAGGSTLGGSAGLASGGAPVISTYSSYSCCTTSPINMGSGNTAVIGPNGGIWHGGGGTSGITAYNMLPGNSIYGGGGGSGNGGTGGTSTWGGSGGNSGATPTAGTQPAGGGGSSTSANVNGANGGAGRVIITSW
jgi:hypothetical protein